jgi:hypothetical protein
MAKLGVETEVVHPACCGMPKLELGHIEAVAVQARKVSAALLKWVDEGYDVVALTPSCALMLKFEWPLILPHDADIRRLSQSTFDVSEYVVDIARTEGLPPGLEKLEGGVSVHLACHARAQNMGAKAAEMLRLVPGTRVAIHRALQRPWRHLGRPHGEFRRRRQGRHAGGAGGAQERDGACGLGMPARGRAPLAGHGNRRGRQDSPAVPRPASHRAIRPRLRVGGVNETMTASRRRIETADILPMAEYAKVRGERRKRITELKQHRRLEVGPFATFYFESYDTMLHQVHEMLFIERGGAEQVPDELAAYNPLIPRGAELVATVMFEIDEPVQRARALATLGRRRAPRLHPRRPRHGPRRGGSRQERTREDGKASSVQFIRFAFTPAQIAAFKGGQGEVVAGFDHANYGHMAVMPAAVRQALAGDFG